MISINWIGIVLSLFLYFPYMIYLIFNKDKKGKTKYRQIEIIEYISKAGIIFFGFINLNSYGYIFKNKVLEILWILLFFIAILFYYFCWLRYFLNGRNKKNLYDKIIFPYPIGILECFIYAISGALLLNPFVIIFSIPYSISHIFLGLRRKDVWQ